MRVIDQNINRKRNKTLNQFELSMWENTKFISLAIVEGKRNGDVLVKVIPSISYADYDMKTGYSRVSPENDLVSCLIVENLTVEEGDVVLMVFTDMDSRETIEDIRRGRNKKETFSTANTVFHNVNYGIIINKIAI